MPIPPQWKINPEQSECTFTATQNNAPIKGQFKDIKGEITFAPEKLAESYAKILINMNSASTSYKELSDILKTADWFDVKLFPEAVFKSNRFTKKGEKEYQVDGTLSIRDKTMSVSLPFIIDNYSKDKLQVHGSTTIKRSDFGVGQGDWSSTDEVKNDVKIDYKLDLSPI